MSNKITKKHAIFVEKYLSLMNATQAYLAVYPKTDYASARVSASRLLTKDNIKSLVEERLLEMQMTANVALKLQADIANGDVAELMEITTVGGSLDLKTAKERGLTKLIKKFKQKTTTYIAKKESDEDREVNELEIELYPADVAQERILKMHGKFTDKLDITSNGETLKPPQIIEVVKQYKDETST